MARRATPTDAASSATRSMVCTLFAPDCSLQPSSAALQNATTFNKTISQDLQPFDFSGAENLFNTTVSCPPSSAIPSSFTASILLNVDGVLHATVSFGAVAAGTLVPPEISDFGLTLGARST
jgi:hypothetical protein